MVVDTNLYSDYQVALANKLKKKLMLNMKLIPNLRNKEKYVLHGQALKLYIQLGMKLTKVYKVQQFEQSDWLQKYISFNIDI